MEGMRDFVIIGAGPSGLQLGYFFQRAGLNHVILEAANRPGNFYGRFPRHRTLISVNKVYTGYKTQELNLRWDWNALLCDDERFLFRNYSRAYFPHANDLLRYLDDFAKHHMLPVRYGARVAQIDRHGDVFEVSDTEGRIERARCVVVATGLGLEFIPDVPGIEFAEPYGEVSVDPEDFCGQRVLVLGKGNSAFETADNLVPTASLIHLVSPSPLQFAWKSHYVGHLRAVNNNFLDTYQLKSQNAVLDARVAKIEKTGSQYTVSFAYEHASEEVEEIVYDRIICCTGFRFDTSIFSPACPIDTAINGRYPDMTASWESTSTPGIYFAGVLMHRCDYRRKQSGFIHGFRYNVRALAGLLQERYAGTPYPRTEIDGTPEGIATAILEDVNTSSSLWQQSGFLASVVVLEDDGTASYYRDFPVAYAHERFADKSTYFVVTLDFGQERVDQVANVFAIDRVHKRDVANANLSTAIHPIVRCGRRGRVVATHHVIEDLRSEWYEDYHRQPLIGFLAGELPGSDCPEVQVPMASAR